MRKTPRALGYELMRKRKKAGLTQADLADEIYTSARHIRRMERGECSIGLYCRAAEFLSDVTVPEVDYVPDDTAN